MGLEQIQFGLGDRHAGGPIVRDPHIQSSDHGSALNATPLTACAPFEGRVVEEVDDLR